MPDGNEYTVAAPGKVFLAGEYSVLAGGWALIATAPVHARAKLCSRPGPGDPFVAAVLRETASRRMESATRSGQRVELDLGGFFSGRVKLGLGSSAAGAAAVVGLVQLVEHGHIGRRDVLARRCAAIHRSVQDGLGSGGDAAASCRGGVIRFRMECSMSPFTLPSWLRLVAVSLGEGGRTATLLGRYRDRLRGGDPGIVANLDVLGESTERIIDALDRSDWHSLRLGVNLMASAYEELGDVLDTALVTPRDRALMRASRRLGGVSRPSGAGGGDLHLAYFGDADAAGRFLEWARSRRLAALPVEPDPRGVRIEKR